LWWFLAVLRLHANVRFHVKWSCSKMKDFGVAPQLHVPADLPDGIDSSKGNVSYPLTVIPSANLQATFTSTGPFTASVAISVDTTGLTAGVGGWAWANLDVTTLGFSTQTWNVASCSRADGSKLNAYNVWTRCAAFEFPVRWVQYGAPDEKSVVFVKLVQVLSDRGGIRRR
jgi:hypothetical protein